MDKDSIIEEISNYKDQRKNLWAVIILLSGGLIGLIYKVTHFNFSINSYIDLLMLVAGTTLDLFLANAISFQNEKILELINKLKEVK